MHRQLSRPSRTIRRRTSGTCIDACDGAPAEPAVTSPALPHRVRRPAFRRGPGSVSATSRRRCATPPCSPAGGPGNRLRRPIRQAHGRGFADRRRQEPCFRILAIPIRFPPRRTDCRSTPAKTSTNAGIPVSQARSRSLSSKPGQADRPSEGLVPSFGDFGNRKLRFPLPVGAPYGSPTGCNPACIVGGRRPGDENLTPSKSAPFERQAHPCHPFPR